MALPRRAHGRGTAIVAAAVLAVVAAPASADASRFPLFNRLFGLPPRIGVCWVSRAQLVAITKNWQAAALPVTLPGRGRFELVTVYGADAATLRRLVSPQRTPCRLVEKRVAFFLPLASRL